jgi:hypothetical protein
VGINRFSEIQSLVVYLNAHDAVGSRKTPAFRTSGAFVICQAENCSSEWSHKGTRKIVAPWVNGTQSRKLKTSCFLPHRSVVEFVLLSWAIRQGIESVSI